MNAACSITSLPVLKTAHKKSALSSQPQVENHLPEVKNLLRVLLCQAGHANLASPVDALGTSLAGDEQQARRRAWIVELSR